MIDIVERLRENNPEMPTRDRYEAANTIEALRAENARLRDALRPFAEEASVEPMPGEPNDPRKCSMKFLLAAKHAVDGGDPYEPLVKELTRMRAENARLREALKPFSLYVNEKTKTYEYEGIQMALIDHDKLMRACLAARAAMGESND